MAASRGPSPELDDRRQNQTTVARTSQPSPEPVDRRQNQTTVARTSRPSPEPDDHRQGQTTIARARRQPFKRPASEHHERFNRSIELNQSLDISPSPNRIELRPPREAPQTTTIQTYSQRTPIKNDSNQSINRIRQCLRSCRPLPQLQTGRHKQ